MNITLEYHRNPLRLELVRHVIPLVLAVAFFATGLGYGWARTAYSNFQRVPGQPISSTLKPDLNHNFQNSPPLVGGDRGGGKVAAHENRDHELLSRVR